ncbi:helix-turn-helix transcriptional regulator [Pseudomonas entomophila]|uniref:helix-turn-helix transcriptional regulator n=1 Tax=Pseudomonas entomophila TaxID=312306 RepID=UPI0031F319D1
MIPVATADRQQLIDDILQRNRLGQETLGTAIRRLRIEVTGLDQETFATMCKLSTRALYQLERDKGNPTLGTLNGILRMFGMTMVLGAIRQSAESPEAERPAARKRGSRPASRKRALVGAP